MVAGMLTFTLLTLYIAVMAFSYGESSDSHLMESPTDLFRSCLGSLDDGLDKLQHFAVGVIDIGTILTPDDHPYFLSKSCHHSNRKNQALMDFKQAKGIASSIIGLS